MHSDQDVSANEMSVHSGINNIDPYGQVINPAASDGTIG